jgi:tripartite-type tricarboxylate transporter receptor subunit TctC
VVARLNAAANAALQQPALRARLAQLGVQPLGGTPAQLQQMVVQTTAVVRKLVQQERVMDAAQ